ncbi:MAG: aspartate/glutamate racemase family protein, partial [Bacteroidia bacterium]|nr:aspartate/glutamate racemase family protein [Bacteroidia bacterium]
EIVGNFSKTKHVGILGTNGTVSSNSYPIEIEKFFPELKVYQEACPMWVPLIESNELDSEGTDYFVKLHIDAILKKSPEIDAIVLGCTHYPLLINKIKEFLPAGITILTQGEIVAKSLKEYLHRHPEMKERCSQNKAKKFFTTDSSENFDKHASLFFGEEVNSEIIIVP